MDHKVGDRVRIRSKEWIDAQEKDEGGNIRGGFVDVMFAYAGRAAKIVAQAGVNFWLDIDYGVWAWHDEMFDPDYDPYGPLSAKDAILAMVEGGETLYDEDGDAYRFNEEETRLEYVGSEDGVVRVLKLFSWAPLRRRPRRNRDWTQWELLAWASSDESRGWVVRTVGSEAWFTPQFFGYGTVGVAYQRARLLPDHSGIDEDTIQGFEVENG